MSKNIEELIYPYHQFSDDENIMAIFKAYNQISVEILSWLYQRPLALYTRESIKDGFLNYLTYSLYGQFRYKISYQQSQTYSGSIDDTDINRTALAEETIIKKYKGTSLSDDIHKRILTWNFYKGDGLNFSIPWLKRRIMRFLTGDNGHCWKFNSCNAVSLTVSGRDIIINISTEDWDSSLVDTLRKIIGNGILNTPPMFNYIVINKNSISE